MVMLVCRHPMHLTCAQPWLGAHSTCPVCKADLLQLANAAAACDDGSGGADGAGAFDSEQEEESGESTSGVRT